LHLELAWLAEVKGKYSERLKLMKKAKRRLDEQEKEAGQLILLRG